MIKVIGVSLVKNEIDILPYVLYHLMAEGINHFMIADNLSTDGTREYLQKLGELKFPITPSTPHFVVKMDNDQAYNQSMKMNLLVQASAEYYGKDIIILPFDADEMFHSTDPSISLSDRLRQMGTGLTHATVYDMQHSQHSLNTGNPLRDMIMRETNVKALPSVAFSYEERAQLLMGNHDCIHTGPIHSDLIAVRHFQYRSLEHFRRKVDNGVAAYNATGMVGHMSHWAQYAAMNDHQLEDEWIKMTNQDMYGDNLWVYDPAPYKGIK